MISTPDKPGNVEIEKAGNLGPPTSGDPTQSKHVGPALVAGPSSFVEGAALSAPLGFLAATARRPPLIRRNFGLGVWRDASPTDF
jgi:hypothetical protein